MVEFSPLERLMLANQFRILSAVAPEEARYYNYEEKIKILQGGFEAEYPSVLGRFAENRLSADGCRLVVDTLLMVSHMLDHLGQTNANIEDFEYVEFDAVTESDYLAYAKFVYESRPEGFPGIRGVVDAHRASNIGRYAKMVEAWKQTGQRDLTEADIARILAAPSSP